MLQSFASDPSFSYYKVKIALKFTLFSYFYMKNVENHLEFHSLQRTVEKEAFFIF